MASIALHNIGKVYPGGTRAVRDLSLTVTDGEFLVLVGPSGCGKSTALRMIAGLEDISEGTLEINGRAVNHCTPQQRNIAMVFQSYALYPHLDVRRNLAFPLAMRGMARAAIHSRVEEVAAMIGLTDLLDRKPKQLSGGQRQRVAMGRALVREPAAFLMDEPLSNLDAKLRVQMRAEISSLQRRTNTTTVYVTHDQVEAMTMGHRVAVMRGGILQQVAPPQELYDSPANAFVAAFIGSPSMNLFKANLGSGAHGEMVMHFAEQQVAVQAPALARLPTLGHEAAFIGLRPESFVPPDAVEPACRLQVMVDAIEPLGHEQMLHFTLPVEHLEQGELGRDGDCIHPQLEAVARLPAHLPAQVGNSLTLGLRSAELHAFAENGQRLDRAPSATGV